MLFEKTQEQSTDDLLTAKPVSICKKYQFRGEKMICSGSTMGSTQAIFDYIDVMIIEFDNWKVKEQCYIKISGDDQAIHNYLYYTNTFHSAVPLSRYTEPTHVVCVQAANIFSINQKIKLGTWIKGIDVNSFK